MIHSIQFPCTRTSIGFKEKIQGETSKPEISGGYTIENDGECKYMRIT